MICIQIIRLNLSLLTSKTRESTIKNKIKWAARQREKIKLILLLTIFCIVNYFTSVYRLMSSGCELTFLYAWWNYWLAQIATTSGACSWRVPFFYWSQFAKKKTHSRILRHKENGRTPLFMNLALIVSCQLYA